MIASVYSTQFTANGRCNNDKEPGSTQKGFFHLRALLITSAISNIIGVIIWSEEKEIGFSKSRSFVMTGE